MKINIAFYYIFHRKKWAIFLSNKTFFFFFHFRHKRKMPNFWPCKSLPKRNGHLDTSGVSTGGHSVAYEDPDAHLHHHPLVRHHNMEVIMQNKIRMPKKKQNWMELNKITLFRGVVFCRMNGSESNYTFYRKIIWISLKCNMHASNRRKEINSQLQNKIITF